MERVDVVAGDTRDSNGLPTFLPFPPGDLLFNRRINNKKASLIIPNWFIKQLEPVSLKHNNQKKINFYCVHRYGTSSGNCQVYVENLVTRLPLLKKRSLLYRFCNLFLQIQLAVAGQSNPGTLYITVWTSLV